MFRTIDPKTPTTAPLQLLYAKWGENNSIGWLCQFDSLCSLYCLLSTVVVGGAVVLLFNWLPGSVWLNTLPVASYLVIQYSQRARLFWIALVSVAGVYSLLLLFIFWLHSSPFFFVLIAYLLLIIILLVLPSNRRASSASIRRITTLRSSVLCSMDIGT